MCRQLSLKHTYSQPRLSDTHGLSWKTSAALLHACITLYQWMLQSEYLQVCFQHPIVGFYPANSLITRHGSMLVVGVGGIAPQPGPCLPQMWHKTLFYELKASKHRHTAAKSSILWLSKYAIMSFRPELHPGPRWGSSPCPVWGGDNSPRPDPFRASIWGTVRPNVFYRAEPANYVNPIFPTTGIPCDSRRIIAKRCMLRQQIDAVAAAAAVAVQTGLRDEIVKQ